MSVLTNRLRWSLSILLLLGLLVYIDRYIGWMELISPWRSVDPPILLMAALLVLSSYVIRTLRLYHYFRIQMQGAFPTTLKLMLQHNLANNLLPMRSGEVTFPILMSRYFSIPLSHSMPALLWFRVLDLHTLGLFAIGSIAGQWMSRPLHGLLLLLWLSLPWGLLLINHWLLTQLNRNNQGRLISFLIKLLQGAPTDHRLLFNIWGWTLLNWLVKLAAFTWLLMLFAEITWIPALLGVIGGELTSVLPVHGIAGAGTYEAGIVAAMLPFGINTGNAISAAVNVHLFLLGITLVGGALSLILRGRDDA